MSQGGNITYKHPKETTDKALIQNIPHGLWKRCRIKSIDMDIPMKMIFVKLLEKFVNGEVEI